MRVEGQRLRNAPSAFWGVLGWGVLGRQKGGRWLMATQPRPTRRSEKRAGEAKQPLWPLASARPCPHWLLCRCRCRLVVLSPCRPWPVALPSVVVGRGASHCIPRLHLQYSTVEYRRVRSQRRMSTHPSAGLLPHWPSCRRIRPSRYGCAASASSPQSTLALCDSQSRSLLATRHHCIAVEPTTRPWPACVWTCIAYGCRSCHARQASPRPHAGPYSREMKKPHSPDRRNM